MKKLFVKNIDALDFSEVVKTVNGLENSKQAWHPLKIAFLRNITIDPIIPYLRFMCFEEGFKADIYMGNYDNVMQDILSSESFLYKHEADILVVCLKIDTLSESLSKSFVTIYPNEIKREIDYLLGYIEKVFKGIRRNTNAMVLIHNFETPVYPSFGILDYQDRSKQINTFRQINLRLVDLVNRYENTFIVDTDLLQSILGYHRFIDKRYWHIGRSPYTRESLMLMAKEYIKFLKANKGKNSKCLVLDCDNTLWGGIIGEDGIENIKIGKTYPGSPYLEFQQAILNLYNRGVVLAICSKNNEKEVRCVLKDHPDMLLRENNFANIKVNWNDKVTNLKSISKELNIGLDSLVFVDDSKFETNMVIHYLPEVKVINLPKDPTRYQDILNSSGFFDSLTFSEEDKLRGQMYCSENKRKKFKAQFTNLEEYYRSLEMELIICNADDFSISRIAQLTQRTNQFNLTTQRFSESEIRDMSNSNDYKVLSIRLKDHFGDAGIIGVAILNYMEDHAIIDAFLLSCRVIGRGIEDVSLKLCMEQAKSLGKQEIHGLYIKTRKNDIASDFYQKRGFSLMYQGKNETMYRFVLDKPFFNFTNVFKSIEAKM